MRCLPALPELGIAQHATSTSAAADLHYWPCCCTAPSTYVYNTNETTYFVLNTLPTTNKNAQRFCNDLGGHLAYYETFEQQVGLAITACSDAAAASQAMAMQAWAFFAAECSHNLLAAQC